MEWHPIASVFPMLADDELQSLADDIREHGLKEPIWTFEGKVLDGRNRMAACTLAGVEPRFKPFTGSRLEALAHSWSINRSRRHLTSSQAAAAEVRRAELVAEYGSQLEEEQAAAVAAKKTGKGDDGSGGRGKKKPSGKNSRRLSEGNRPRSKRAKRAGTNPRYIQDAEKIKQDRPDLFAMIESGQLTIPQALRQIKEEAREKRRSENAGKVSAAATSLDAIGAKFASIVIDPPWDWGDEGDCDQLGRARPQYATMSLPDLLKLPVPSVADVDCHLYLWITNRSLPKGFSLIEEWGFRYVTCLTWCKPSFGMGNYFRGSTEQVLFAVRGSQPLKRKNAGTWFAAKRGPNGHSSKPTEFYGLVESCSPGPHLEVFARGGRDGWTSWGAEAP